MARPEKTPPITAPPFKWNMWIIGGLFGITINLFVMGLLVFGLIMMVG